MSIEGLFELILLFITKILFIEISSESLVLQTVVLKTLFAYVETFSSYLNCQEQSVFPLALCAAAISLYTSRLIYSCLTGYFLSFI